jgi:hypothetical protein
MIDNLELIKPLLSFDEGYFYVLYVMTSNKDLGITVPEKAQKHRVIKEYYIESLDYLEKKYEEIKKLCGVFNARAYINLNRVNKEKLGLEILEQLTIKLKHKDSNYFNVLSKAIGNCKTDNRVWVVDLDSLENQLENKVLELVNSVQPLEENKVLGIIPTPNGKHILTKPFNVMEFAKLSKNLKLKIDIQKNNPTLLYYSGATFAKVLEPEIRPQLQLENNN